MAPLLKPKSSKLTRWKAKHQRQIQRDKRKKAEAALEAVRERQIREAVFKRDNGACRVCGMRVYLHHANPFKVMQAHHVIYKSAGGDDSLGNRITTCAECHDDEHTHRIDISGTADKLTVKELHV